MKLRIKGNSLRLRATRSELIRLMQNGRIEDTIQFAEEKDSSLTYALECSPNRRDVGLCYSAQTITIAIPLEDARSWISSDQVGISHDLQVGDRVLAILVEKDFACLDGADATDTDKYPNPNVGTIC